MAKEPKENKLNHWTSNHKQCIPRCKLFWCVFFFAPHVILWYLRIPLLLFIDQERSINRVITPVYPTVHSSWLVVHPHRITNEDGRCPGLITKENFTPGVYKLYFETAGYWASLGETCFYPYVEVRIFCCVLSAFVLQFCSINSIGWQFEMCYRFYVLCKDTCCGWKEILKNMRARTKQCYTDNITAEPQWWMYHYLSIRNIERGFGFTV